MTHILTFFMCILSKNLLQERSPRKSISFQLWSHTKPQHSYSLAHTLSHFVIVSFDGITTTDTNVGLEHADLAWIHVCASWGFYWCQWLNDQALRFIASQACVCFGKRNSTRHPHLLLNVGGQYCRTNEQQALENILFSSLNRKWQTSIIVKLFCIVLRDHVTNFIFFCWLAVLIAELFPSIMKKWLFLLSSRGNNLLEKCWETF